MKKKYIELDDTAPVQCNGRTYNVTCRRMTDKTKDNCELCFFDRLAVDGLCCAEVECMNFAREDENTVYYEEA